MGKGIFILGSDTDVGKTFVSSGITYILRKNGYNACGYKCIQSGGIKEDGKLISGDIKFLKDVTDINEDYENMNPYSLEPEVSPHLAAEIEKVYIDKEVIIDGYKKIGDKYNYIIAEGSGGLVVPIIRNEYYIYDLIKDLDLPVILVTRANVGTINHTTLTVEFARKHNIDIKGIIINNYSNKYYEDDNIRVIEDITGIPILSVINKLDTKDVEEIRKEYERSIDIDKIIKVFE